ncbi:MAG: NIF family HAD-type phosphatase [Pseudomonadota bacterium]
MTTTGAAASLHEAAWSKPPKACALEYEGVGPVPVRWEEHCSECDAPGCYASCALHDPAPVVGCRRFEFGIDQREDPFCWTSTHADIVWRRWAALKIKAESLAPGSIWRYGFLLQLYLDSDRPLVSAEVAISASPWRSFAPCVRIPVPLGAGINEIYISPADLHSLAGSTAVEARLVFGESQPHALRLYAAHFVEGVVGRDGQTWPPCKLVCLDLDETLWSGAADEVPPESLELRPGVRRTLEEFRRRRISIAAVTRASPEAALRALRELGLHDLFDDFQFVRSSKSEAVRHLADTRALSTKEIVIVDDDAFERHCLARDYEGFGILTPDRLPAMWLHPRFSTNIAEATPGAVTALVARSPRDLETAVNPRVTYRSPGEAETVRCWELLHRTNRMNCVEWRPTLADFVARLADINWAIRIGVCSDDLSDYGVTCLAVVDRNQRVLGAMTFSCRLLERLFPDMFVSHLLEEFGTLKIERPNSRLAPHGERLLRKMQATTLRGGTNSDCSDS